MEISQAMVYCPIAHQGELGMQKCTALDFSNWFQSFLGIHNSTLFFKAFTILVYTLNVGNDYYLLHTVSFGVYIT